MTDPTPATRLDRAWEALLSDVDLIDMPHTVLTRHRPLIEAAVLEAARERVEGRVAYVWGHGHDCNLVVCRSDVLAALREVRWLATYCSVCGRRYR